MLLRDSFVCTAFIEGGPGLGKAVLIASLLRPLSESRHVAPAAVLDTLADALEEAGADAEFIDHLREPGPHARGCWVVDRLLGLT